MTSSSQQRKEGGKVTKGGEPANDCLEKRIRTSKEKAPQGGNHGKRNQKGLAKSCSNPPHGMWDVKIRLVEHKGLPRGL